MVSLPHASWYWIPLLSVTVCALSLGQAKELYAGGASVADTASLVPDDVNDAAGTDGDADGAVGAFGPDVGSATEERSGLEDGAATEDGLELEAGPGLGLGMEMPGGYDVG